MLKDQDALTLAETLSRDPRYDFVEGADGSATFQRLHDGRLVATVIPTYGDGHLPDGRREVVGLRAVVSAKDDAVVRHLFGEGAT